MKLKINGIVYTNDKILDQTQTLIQACETFGYSIPRFCYHQKLSVAGNCRMCLVDVENSVKPVASCAVMQAPNMSILTESAITRKARESVMEFLLLNHPLDCPVCDQGGECDLQDQSMLFGNDRGRFYGFKRSVTNKDIGLLVKMVMTRCIHCTRCVRFANDIAGVNDLGVTGRGNSMEIGPYIQKLMTSELSGNVIDLCPVGALTSKPYSFTGRPWELVSTDSVDIMDSLGSSITVQTKQDTIVRIIPKANDSINEDWITDKTRFSYDGVTENRSCWYLVNSKTNPSLDKAPYLFRLSKSLYNQFSKIDIDSKSFDLAIYSEQSDSEELIMFKNLFNNVSFNNRSNSFFYGSDLSFSSIVNNDYRHWYRFNTSLQDITKSDYTLIIGIDLRIESPLLHSKLSSRLRPYGVAVSYLGGFINSKLGGSQLGNTIQSVYNIFSGVTYLCQSLLLSKYPSIIVGNSKSKSVSSDTFMHYVTGMHIYLPQLFNKVFTSSQNNKDIFWNGINKLASSANTFFSKDFHVFTKHNNILKNLSLDYLLKNTNVLYDLKSNYLHNRVGSVGAFYISLDTHVPDIYFSNLFKSSTRFLVPLNTAFEKKSILFNTEGRLQITTPSLTSFEPAKDSVDRLFDTFSQYSQIRTELQNFYTNLVFSSNLTEGHIDYLSYINKLCPPVCDVDSNLFTNSIISTIYSYNNNLQSSWLSNDLIVPGSRTYYNSGDQIATNSSIMSDCNNQSIVSVNFLVWDGGNIQ